MESKRTIIIGLGNPLLGDDGIGWKVAERVRDCLQSGWSPQREIDVESLALGGLSLMEHLIGYDQAILIDAITLDKGKPGSVISVAIDALPGAPIGHTSSSHDTTLQSALELGRRLGARLPDEIYLVGIQAEVKYDFTEDLTADIAAAIPNAVQAVMDLLRDSLGESTKGKL